MDAIYEVELDQKLRVGGERQNGEEIQEVTDHFEFVVVVAVVVVVDKFVDQEVFVDEKAESLFVVVVVVIVEASAEHCYPFQTTGQEES